ncbi:hypothetical protein I4U23_008817 [Adineta vaga]|nr:hypothetical protein I4U23_008817 [Adineta vaga]
MKNNAFQPMTTGIHYCGQKSSTSLHRCIICGSKSIGINFGVLTCAPCKAFFRRNARRKELLELPCRHRDLSALIVNESEMNERTMRYLQIRRCSSCRLRRCFDVGMKEELVRTDEENERYKQLVGINRKRRDMLRQQLLEIKDLAIPQRIFIDVKLSADIDWNHLSNIVYAYDSCCIKTYIRQRSTTVFTNESQVLDNQSISIYPTAATMAIVLSVSAFLKALPAYHSLPRSIRNYLCKTNIRPLIFPSIHELNQSCFHEAWQTAAYKTTWQLMCGSQLYEFFHQAEILAETKWVTDPIVTRLFVVILFFSTPLHYHDNCATPTKILKKKQPLIQIQNAYATLLWKYLLYRYDMMGAVRIFSNLVNVYIKMQTVGFGIYTQLATQKNLIPTNETLNKLVTLDVNEVQID